MSSNSPSLNVRGSILQPSDPGYDEARRIWNGMVDKRPDRIVQCSDASDVVAAVNHARESGSVLAVRGGGHSFAGKSVCDGGTMIDLSRMRGVRVLPDERRAHVQGGALWGDLDGAAQEFGLATTGGLISHTGVAGLTLGGGIGWLARKHGLAADNLVSAEVVTASGQRVRASESENPDLFWGLRGGSGNFGVVTSFEFQLHPVGPEVLAGFIVHPFEAASDGLRFYREFTAEAPDEVACYAMFSTIPSQAPFPQSHWGQTAFTFAVCHCGPAKQAERDLAPLRAFGKPLLDAVAPMQYAALQQAFDEAQEPGNRWYGKSGFWDGLPDEAIDTLVSHVDPLSGPLTMIFLEPLGGAIGRVPVDATAFPHRTAPYNFGLTSGWIDSAEDDEHRQWTRDFYQHLSKFGEGVYVNYADEDESGQVGQSFGTNYARLVQVKNDWDPDNLFRMNMNVEPTASA